MIVLEVIFKLLWKTGNNNETVINLYLGIIENGELMILRFVELCS